MDTPNAEQNFSNDDADMSMNSIDLLQSLQLQNPVSVKIESETFRKLSKLRRKSLNDSHETFFSVKRKQLKNLVRSNSSLEDYMQINNLINRFH